MSATPVLDPRERFLRDIAERIPADRIAEIHLFPPLRSGGRESGVAVIAALADVVYVQRDLPPPVGESPDGGSGEVEAQPVADAGTGVPPDIEATPDPAEVSDRSIAERIEPAPGDAGPSPDLESTPPRRDRSDHSAVGDIETSQHRLVVYRAVYRWTRKGPDRGRWEVDVTAEADAPLHAVSDVVRGVQRRAGEEGEPELITPDALRAALSSRPWATAM